MTDQNPKFFISESDNKEHSYPLGAMVKFKAREDDEYDDTNNILKRALYAGSSFFIIAHRKDCDGTLLYNLSTLPIDIRNGETMTSFILKNIITDDVKENLDNPSICALISKIQRSFEISGINEDSIKPSF